MKRLRAAFAASVLAAATTGCIPPTPPERPENFNPVREQLQQHGLLQMAETDRQTLRVCQLDSDLVVAALKAGDRDWFVHGSGQGLMFTFYTCNAISAYGFRDNPHNDAIAHPSPGQTAAQVKDQIRSELSAQEAELCRGLAVDPAQNDLFITKFCEALKPST